MRTLGSLLQNQARPLVSLVLLLYLPFYLLYKGVVFLQLLPAEAADVLFGLISGVLAPLGNAAAVYVLHHGAEGVAAPLADALRASGRVFFRLFVSYLVISVSFLVVAAACVLPAILANGLLGGSADLENAHRAWVLVPFILPGFYFVSRYAFIDMTTVLEDLEGPLARYRSIDLTKGRRLRLTFFGLLLAGPPTALDLTADAVAGWAAKSYGAPDLIVGVGLGLVANLLYLIPLAYFYLAYRAVPAPPPAAASTAPATANVISFRRKDGG